MTVYRSAWFRSACFIAALLFSTAAGFAQVAELPGDDNQAWTDVHATVGLRQQVDLVLYGAFRLGRNWTDFVNERAGGGLALGVGKFLTVTPGYYFIGSQPSEGLSFRENRPFLEATVRFGIGKFMLSDRNRAEWRFLLGGRSWRYRNRLQIERPFELAHTSLKLFISDEITYSGLLNSWVRNRLAAGVGKSLSPNTTAEVYYLRQNDRFSRPGDLHVLGFTLRLRF